MSSCVQCGSVTRNPRFCSRECAVTFNNRANPKRKPEGRCEACGTTIPARKRRCVPCVENERRAQHDRSEGIFEIRRLDGSVERVNAPPVPLRERTLVTPLQEERLGASVPAERFFERALGVLAAAPAWLRPAEIAQHAALWRDLAEFAPRLRARTRRVKTQPLSDLPRNADLWLRTFEHVDDPLALSFALDSVEFLFDLLRGRRGSEQPDLEPIVLVHPTHDLYRLDDRQRRKEYSERVLRGLHVVARTPPDMSFRRNGEVIIPPNSTFGGELIRCHLSQSLDDYVSLTLDGPRLRPFDRIEDFALLANILGMTTNDARKVVWAPGQRSEPNITRARVPAHWIIGTFNPYDDPLAERITPVRTWA